MQALKQCLADSYIEISDNPIGGSASCDTFMIDDGAEIRANSCGEPHVGLCQVQARVRDAETVDVCLRWDDLKNTEILAWARRMGSVVSTAAGVTTEFSVGPCTLFRFGQLAGILDTMVGPDVKMLRVPSWNRTCHRTSRALRRLAIVLEGHWRVDPMHWFMRKSPP